MNSGLSIAARVRSASSHGLQLARSRPSRLSGTGSLERHCQRRGQHDDGAKTQDLASRFFPSLLDKGKEPQGTPSVTVKKEEHTLEAPETPSLETSSPAQDDVKEDSVTTKESKEGFPKVQSLSPHRTWQAILARREAELRARGGRVGQEHRTHRTKTIASNVLKTIKAKTTPFVTESEEALSGTALTEANGGEKPVGTLSDQTKEGDEDGGKGNVVGRLKQFHATDKLREGKPAAWKTREPRLPFRLTEEADNVSHKMLNYKIIKGTDPLTIARLEHGLEKVLFNPNTVHRLQCPRTGVFNFSPHLKSIPQPDEFDFRTIPAYHPASKDQNLIGMTKLHGSRYCGSTSSLTSTLSQFCFLLTQHRGVDTRNLSAIFESQLKTLTKITKSPTSILVNWRDGCYGIDAEKPDEDELEGFELDRPNEMILASLGKIMERQLTLSESDFQKHLVGKSDELLARKAHEQPEAFHFATASKFMLRAQLDCFDTRLPKGSFDLKTRADLAIRMDQVNYKDNLGYKLRKTHGLFESFEREYYDMIRSAFLKYSLQVRIGNMDGIFVAYHNTDEIFGFQYIPLETMDEHLFGSTVLAHQTFANSLLLFEKLLDRITGDFKEKSFKLTIHARGGKELLVAYAQLLDDPSVIEKYVVVAQSVVNGERQFGPFELEEKDDWLVYYKIDHAGGTSSSQPGASAFIREEYEDIRAECANLFDNKQAAPSTQRSNMMQALRKVFQKSAAEDTARLTSWKEAEGGAGTGWPKEKTTNQSLAEETTETAEPSTFTPAPDVGTNEGKRTLEDILSQYPTRTRPIKTTLKSLAEEVATELPADAIPEPEEVNKNEGERTLEDILAQYPTRSRLISQKITRK